MVFGYTMFEGIKTKKCEKLAKILLQIDKKFAKHQAEIDNALTKNGAKTSNTLTERSGVHGQDHA